MLTASGGRTVYGFGRIAVAWGEDHSALGDVRAMWLLRLGLTWLLLISLSLWSTVSLDNVVKVQPILNGRCADLVPSTRIISTKELNLLLLHFLNSLASEILKISETSIVLDIIYHRCKILLLR